MKNLWITRNKRFFVIISSYELISFFTFPKRTKNRIRTSINLLISFRSNTRFFRIIRVMKQIIQNFGAVQHKKQSSQKLKKNVQPIYWRKGQAMNCINSCSVENFKNSMHFNWKRRSQSDIEVKRNFDIDTWMLQSILFNGIVQEKWVHTEAIEVFKFSIKKTPVENHFRIINQSIVCDTWIQFEIKMFLFIFELLGTLGEFC